MIAYDYEQMKKDALKQDIIDEYIKARNEANKYDEADENDPDRICAYAYYAGMRNAIAALGGFIKEDRNDVNIEFKTLGL